MQYRPNEVIGLSYLISDPADAGTYYVRAVLRDTRTNETLRTVDLTVDASNSRRFYGEMQMPDVKMNQSRSVDITTTVYTDSGYTTQSQEHQEICNMYIVAERWNEAMGFSGGGSGLTPKQVREAVTRVLDEREASKKPEPTKTPEKKPEVPKEVKKLLSDTLQAVKDAEKSLKKAVSDSDSREAVSDAKKALEAATKSIPEAAKAAMQMLLKDMQRSDRSESSENISKAIAEMKEAQNAIIEAIAEQFKPMVESLNVMAKRMEKLEQKQWTIALTPLDNVKPSKKGEDAEEKEEDPLPPIGDFMSRARERIGKK